MHAAPGACKRQKVSEFAPLKMFPRHDKLYGVLCSRQEPQTMPAAKFAKHTAIERTGHCRGHRRAKGRAAWRKLACEEGSHMPACEELMESARRVERKTFALVHHHTLPLSNRQRGTEE